MIIFVERGWFVQKLNITDFLDKIDKIFQTNATSLYERGSLRGLEQLVSKTYKIKPKGHIFSSLVLISKFVYLHPNSLRKAIKIAKNRWGNKYDIQSFIILVVKISIHFYSIQEALTMESFLAMPSNTGSTTTDTQQ